MSFTVKSHFNSLRVWCLSAGGTDIGPQPQIASSRPVGPRRSSRPFSALLRRAEGGSQHGLSASGGGDGPGLSGQVVEIAAGASRALPPPAGAVGRRDREPRRRRGPAFSLGGRSGQPRNAWGNLSHADRITNAVESSTGKRLPLPQIGGGSRAGPTSGMRSTATALRAGMEEDAKCPAHRNHLLSQSSRTTESYFKASHLRPDQPTLVRLVPPKEVKYEQMKCFIASEISAPSS
ncbi:Forkhead box protein O3 [Manis javanica]|nr:Forkhead box protein O3 [Manis javanica]